jgi:hypothetical protein
VTLMLFQRLRKPWFIGVGPNKKTRKKNSEMQKSI